MLRQINIWVQIKRVIPPTAPHWVSLTGDTVKKAIRNVTGAIRAAITIERKSKNRSVVVPKGNRILTKGTLRIILKQAGLSQKEFLKLL
ncbi:hypothetical protein HY086_02580 [Candidatus Gottesmanbacteria bacterium]|nr:hypothetical protein [Candidatus Gottesmanbacteria bacterium]